MYIRCKVSPTLRPLLPSSPLTGNLLSLLESATDEKLAEALTVVFGRYGTVFVKIKRKATNMPYAFVQFTVSQGREP